MRSGQDKSKSIQDQLYPNEQGWYTDLRPANTQTTLVDATFAAPSPSKTTSSRPERPFTREEVKRTLPRFALPPPEICQALPVVYIQSFLAGHSIKTMNALGGFSAGGRWPKLLDQERVVLEKMDAKRNRYGLEMGAKRNRYGLEMGAKRNRYGLEMGAKRNRYGLEMGAKHNR
ncbi:uncharacterized protein P174DRAFT_421338 [Aspergillus novofumigatus IBT 16806]|uniref:Uncharacterized protein n=1 Tax=Aspergillus novofumigatus (strain IBT 16806) TaxID=1392255 RepID=A0A2I1C3T8_ASPN1|nr:uncharacterized protein P174DRAFT_421338 [Aspergillus novofumigatus IBT 16806]PKX92263.1 hypothetical protein P174DRAFT_421338 [Aspergillus novofumigatus IBT 16806]